MSAEQLWLDVDRPIQMAPQRKSKRARAAADDRQMEFPIAPEPLVVTVASCAMPAAVAALISEPSRPAQPDPPFREMFGSWLLAQAAKRGSIGDLAKAAKLDRAFPRSGSVDDVRARFGVLGADGDAYEALEDAERQYERLAA